MQGHQQLGALTGSINIFLSTIITLYEVESQKTLNTKFGKRIKWFSEVIKEFYHYFQEKCSGIHKKTETKVALHCIPKADQSILQNPMIKKFKHF